MSPNANRQARPAVYEDDADVLESTALAPHAAVQISSEFDKENTTLQAKASGPVVSDDVMQERVPLGFLQTSEARAMSMSTPKATVSIAPASMIAAVDISPEEVQSPIGTAELPQVPPLPFEIMNTFIEAVPGQGHMPPWAPLSPATRRTAPGTEPKSFKPAERFGGALMDDYFPSPIPPAPEPVTPSVVDVDEDMVPNTASPVRLWAAGEGQGKALEVEESFVGDTSFVSFTADASVSCDLGEVNETTTWSTAGVKKTLSLVDSLRNANRQVSTSASTTLSTSSASRYVLRVAEYLPPTTYAPMATFSLSGALGLDDDDEEDDLPPRNLFGC